MLEEELPEPVVIDEGFKQGEGGKHGKAFYHILKPFQPHISTCNT